MPLLISAASEFSLPDFVQLSPKALLGKRIQPIKLPKPEMKLKDNAKCRVAGWGFTKTGGKSVDVLHVADVAIVNMKQCKEQWRRFTVNLPSNVTCAGGYKTDKGFCQVCFSLYEMHHLVSSLKCRINKPSFFLLTG